jgi:integrase
MTTRRGRGEGSLYQRHDHATCPPVGDDGERPKHRCRGRWVKTIDLGWSNGTRRRKVIYGTTKGEVLDKERDLLRTGRAEHPASTHTVKTWMTYWLEHIAPDRCRPQTLAGYASKINQYVIPLIGRHRLDKLEPRHLREMYERMGTQCPPQTRGEPCTHSPSHGLSHATRRQTHAIIRRALTIALRERLVVENVATLIDAPSTYTARRDRLTSSEARLVLAKADADDPDYTARWWLGFQEGMRQGEALGLPWMFVDFEQRTIAIVRTLVTVGGRLAYGEPKSETSKRIIPMTPQVHAHLLTRWGAYVARCEAAGVPVDLTSPVFAQAHGGPVGPKTDWKRWRNLLASAGVRHVSLHSMRNTTAELLEDAGVQPRLAAEILGHSNESQTYDYQRGRNLEARRNAMVALEGAWSVDQEPA